MQVDHIDENTIRVRINKDELAQRGLKGLDLLGNKEMIQQFFYSILAEVDTEHTFTKGAPVSFQVMPNSNGLDLLISKVQDGNVESLKKMLNSGPSHFDSSESSDDKDLASFFDLDPNDDEKTEIDPSIMTNSNSLVPEKTREDYWKFQNSHYYRFKDLGDVVELADSLYVTDLASSLYFYQDAYFLKLAFLDENYVELKPADAWAIANEYGIKITDQQMKAVINSGKCILQRDALGNLRKYFKNSYQK